jgi:aminoglycoside phosphotransferase (APT) family kinase protein
MKKTAQDSGMRPARARSLVKQIVEHHFGGRPRRIERQSGGLSNLVFAVERDSAAYIVRLNPDRAQLNLFLKEQWATTRAREAGVPVPEILEVGNAPVPQMISRKASGEAGSTLPDRSLVLKELGRYAALINSIPTVGFGSAFEWSQNRLSASTGWKDFLEREFGLDRRLRVLARYKMMPRAKLEKIRTVLLEASSDRRKPALNHGDLRLKNVLVGEKGRISAILDWENCSANLAPEWELSLALHDLSIDDKELFLEGYGLPVKAVSKLAPVVKALNIVNYVAKVERLAAAKDGDQLARYRRRLCGDLDLYSF